MNRSKFSPSKGYQMRSKQYRQRQSTVRSKGRSKRLGSAGQKKQHTVRILLFVGGGLTLLIVAGVTGWFFLMSPNAVEQNLPPVMEMELTSNPAGATVVLDGREKGITPLKLPVSSGRRRLEFRKGGYASYFTELEVVGQPPPSRPLTSTVSTTPLSPLATVDKAVIRTAKGEAGTNPQVSTTSSSVVLPTHPLQVELWPDRVIMQPLPKPLPNARFEYARYLNKEVLELTYLSAEGELLPPGEEGLPTNLWLYHPTIHHSLYPVVLTYSTLEAVGRYHYPDPNNSSQTISQSTISGKVAFTTPTVSPEGSRLAFVSNGLVKNPVSVNQKGVQGNANTSNSAVPVWDDQAVWLTRLTNTPSASGAILTGSADATDQPLRLFSLKDLATLLPNLNLPNPTTISSTSSQRWATLRQLSWSPTGDKVLAVIEINEAVLAGSRGSSGNGIVTVMVTIATGSGTPPGQSSLVTPQPLTEEVLSGTLVWNTDGTALSFMVNQNRGGGSNTSNAGLCILDMHYRAKGKSPSGSEASSLNRTPLHYIGPLGSAGVWDTRTSNNSLNNLTGGRVYPLSYGATRYNPFAWPSDAASNHLTTGPKGNLPRSNLGLYSAVATNPASSSVNNLYAYSLSEGVPRPLPLVSSTPGASNNRPVATPTPRPGQLPAQVKTGSYPYQGREGSPLYLAVRPVTSESSKNSSSGGLLGGNTSSVSWHLGVETFALSADLENILQNGSEIKEVAPGISLKKLSEQRQPTALTLPSSSSPAISGLTPGKLEAHWRPDGKGALVVLPPSTASQSQLSNNLWLAIWN